MPLDRILIETNNREYAKHLKSPAGKDAPLLDEGKLRQLPVGTYILTGQRPDLGGASRYGLVMSNVKKVLGRANLTDHLGKPKPGVTTGWLKL